ncbi:MarR family winged helix-turn-helix transcriptional regulator [Piscinibacter sp. HJYY11]|uniref:MarR family winged helix-turn-helix transcriptional regulator n=1 Tax=Piscinibacter sp. HJYY11 TaxID=2801333 RepID=UPI00191EA1C0|nr:MarR family transcriptional regulator [Piscinibacter sp. HJYY11]MBL0727158.1 winged helix DNA-binding protein [Piscinibacter sp. HJYY11]
MTVDIRNLDIGTLWYLVGQGFNKEVLERLNSEGFADVKVSFGYVVQHLLDGDKTATELAVRMGITQQAASKRIREMLDAGVLELAAGKDRRELRVALSPLGRTVVARTRAIREEVAQELLADASAADVRAARGLLFAAIERLGMNPTVEQRLVQEQG